MCATCNERLPVTTADVERIREIVYKRVTVVPRGMPFGGGGASSQQYVAVIVFHTVPRRRCVRFVDRPRKRRQVRTGLLYCYYYTV